MIARYTIAIFATLLVTGLAGCKVDSINPISPIESAQPDAALYGVWRYREKGELTYVHIGPEFSLDAANAAEKKGMRIVLVDHKPNGLTDEAYVAYASRVGKQRYLNIIQVEEGKTAGFILVQYALVDSNTVRFSTVNEEALKAAISAGRIKGTIRGDGLSSQTAVTADSADLQELLRTGTGKLFAAPVTLRRVQDR